MPTMTVERAAWAGRIRKMRSPVPARVVASTFARKPALSRAAATRPMRPARRARRRAPRIDGGMEAAAPAGASARLRATRGHPEVPEELAEIGGEEVGLLEGGEVAAPRHRRPPADVVHALRPRPRRPHDLPGEGGVGGGHR